MESGNQFVLVGLPPASKEMKILDVETAAMKILC